MENLYNSTFVFSNNIRFIENKDKVIIINGCSGIWGFLDKPTLNKINYCIDNKISPLDYIKSLKNQEEMQQIGELFQVLIEEKMIKKPSDKEFNVNIKDVEFKLTNRCNLRCLHCGASSDINEIDSLSTENIKTILDKIFKLNIDSLLLTGGEPLFRKDIKSLLCYIQEKFQGKVNMTTNGTLIDKEMAVLLRKCLNTISISVDGYDRTSTDFVRGKGVYDKIIRAVNYLKEVGFKKEEIGLTMTCTYQNIDHKEDFNKLCDNLNVTGVLRQFTAIGRGLENYKKLAINDYTPTNEKLNEELEQIRESLECKIICTAGTKKLMINELGDLYPCLTLDNEEYKFGNVLKNDLNSIFNSEKYENFIKNKIMKSIVDTLPKCKDCNVRYFCMDSCLGISNSYYKNKNINKERCKQIRPYLNKVVWNE
ncbi:radical SAM protein (plasmid) [Haloimpatiens sp. FM7330]|uniref:radical SAM protein n=1 Tax=Haloimpatiens sp. FM7330 TaxID=3298610 RepID=UPI003636DC85